MPDASGKPVGASTSVSADSPAVHATNAMIGRVTSHE